MFIFVCIAGGLIIACTVFALLIPQDALVTLSDVAARMERMRESQKCGYGGAWASKTRR